LILIDVQIYKLFNYFLKKLNKLAAFDKKTAIVLFACKKIV